MQSAEEASRTAKMAEAPKVLVFTRALPAGHILASIDVRWRALGSSPAPEGSVLKSTQSDADLLGTPLKLPVVAGQLVRPSLLGAKTSEAMLSSKLNPGFRAVTISVDGPQLVSGRLLPNDHVDLLLTPGSAQGSSLIPVPSMPSAQPSMTGVTRLLDNVRILAVGGVTELEKPETGQLESSMLKDTTVTLELRPEDARRLLAANALGKIALLLRRPLDADEPSRGGPMGNNQRALPPLPNIGAPQNTPQGSSSAIAGAESGKAEAPAVIIVRGSN
jgi:pilus assembly protein CpaB